MDLSAYIFGFILFALSLGFTYHWGIRPAREEKARRSKQALDDLRRERWEMARQRRISRTKYSLKSADGHRTRKRRDVESVPSSR
jgi:hypothetical protein